MTSVEKRRSGRKSGSHRKHSDGGYSDTSSGGSFLDETDREVSNLTDRAFRSLCIGDEAVYNDSDLCSSPCAQRERQLAFSQSELDRGREDAEREELKRAAHESFSLRVQQYGQDWVHGGMYGAEIHRDPQWEVYGETQGRVSATFQHSFLETSQQEESLRREQLCYLSNGATELGSQQRRSRSRVSSLIRAFNSEGNRDGTGVDGKLKEWNDEQSWDKSALMSIQRELSEFSTSYQQNFNSGHFPSAGPLSYQDANFYSSEVTSAAHMNSASSFMRSSHSKHSMSAQVNCNSNFFIHSEFSPFKVWRDHNRFPFQQGEVSGFMHSSEFPKWYETPMYKELSLEAPSHSSYRFEDRGTRHLRNNMASVVPSTPLRSTSTSTMMQKTLAVEKRCESELAGYPHRKRTQSMGANRLPSQRPSTASPTIEMSRRVQDTISSVKALQQKIKMMTEPNMTTGMTNQQGMFYGNNDLLSFEDNAKTVASNIVSSNTSTTPFNMGQTSEIRQYAVSPQPVEHAPVRAESRGATPDIRMSSYKSRASSLLFNLKDNRKRVKSTYSPTKFKGLETPSAQAPRDTVIDIPDFPEPDQFDNFSRTTAASHQYENQYHNPGLSLMTAYSQPATTHTGQYSEYTSSDYQQAQMQSEMGHHSGFTGFVPRNYTTNQLANGQNLHGDVSSFTPYKQGMMDNVETMGAIVPRLQSSYTPAEIPRLNTDSNQRREYLIRKDDPEQQFNETAGREFTKVEQLKNNNHDFGNVSSQDRWRQTDSQDADFFSVKSPWKKEISALMEKDQHAAAYQRAAMITEELNLPRDNYRGKIQQSINKEPEKIELRESLGVGTSHMKAAPVDLNISNQVPHYPPLGHQTVENPTYYEQQLPGVFSDKHEFQKYYGQNMQSEIKDSYLIQYYNNTYIDPEYGNQHMIVPNKDKTVPTQETKKRKTIPLEHEIPSPQLTAAKPQFEYDVQKHSFSIPDNTSAATIAHQEEHRHFVEVKAAQAMAEHKKGQHAQAELARAQPSAQVEQPKVESAGLILAGQTCSEKVKGEETKAGLAEQESVRQAKAEHAQEKKGKGEQTVQAREEPIKAGQTKVEKVMVPKMFSDEAGTEHMGEVQGEQVKAKQPEAEGLKEEAIKTEQTKTEQAGQTRIKQATTEQTLSETIKVQQVEKEQLRAEQIAKEQMEAEQIRAEKVKAEQAEAEHKKAEQAQQERIKEQQAKVKQQKTEAAEDGSVQVGQANAEQLKTQMHKAIEEKVKEKKEEQQKWEQPKEELTKAELTKIESMQKCLNQPLVKLRETQQVTSEPDKVEQVKTELAKAKAELAKIKEKMRGDQKEKVRNTILTKEDVMKKDVPLGVNTDKNEVKSDQDQAPQIQQEKKDSAINKQTTQVDRGANEYERLREKYGFTDSTSTLRDKQPAAGTISTNVGNDTVHKVEKPTNENLKDKPSNTSNLESENTGNRDGVNSFKTSDVAECHYVYSESSKEFKLAEPDNLPSHQSSTNTNSMINTVTANSVEKLAKYDPPRPTEAYQQKDLAKAPPLERKPKEKSLSQRERAQTKQEILTSKIKAHAEKEISAIKEKGFALREGFMSKTSSKQLLGQSMNVRQKPPSQEGPKKHESKMHSNTTPRQQMEPSGIQMEPDKFVSTPTSAKTQATTCHFADPPQKKVPKEPMKSNNSVPKTARETEQMGGHITNTENLNKENWPIIASPIQNKVQAPKPKQETQDSNHGEIPGKQKLEDNLSINSTDQNKRTPDSSQARAFVKAESCKPMTTDASKQQTVHEDSAPTLNIAFSQNKTPMAVDDLKIKGIMVTVRERTPPVENIERISSNEDYINAKENKCSNSEMDGLHPSSGQDVISGGKSSQEDGKGNMNDKVEQKTTVKKEQTRVNNQVENVQNAPTLETRQSNTTENSSVKRANLQQVNSPTNAVSQIQHQDAHPENAETYTVSAPAKNGALPEIQSLLYKQDMITSETKDYTNKMSKESLAKSLRKDEVKDNTEEKNQEKTPTVNKMTDSNKVHVKTQIKYDTQQILKEDTTKAMTVINPSVSRNVDVKTATPVEDHESTPPKSLNKTGPSSQLMATKNQQDSTERHPKETNIGHIGQVDNDVHIGGISIRVVPAVAVSSSSDTKANNLNRKRNIPTDGLEDKLGRHLGPSSVETQPELKKINNQQSSKNGTSLNIEAEKGNPEKVNSSEKSVDESKIQPTEGDYFQVQGVVEARAEAHNSKNVSLSSQPVSKGGDLPGLLPNNAVISNDSHKEGKNEAFTGSALDQSKIKTVDSSSASVQDVTMKRRNKETDLTSIQSDPQRDRGNKNEKAEASQAVHTRKQHTENHCSLSGMERQRGLHPSRENAVRETPEVKPKTKEKVSTIPEISALADYARLKVIVSEDRANTIQDFPPNKKEGFFPLIQTRHSRRPTFAADPQDPTMKEKSLPNKTEINSKDNKESKPVAFPITEKEHQRTGMFKLGDKEKQEKMVLDPKVTEGVVDSGAKQMQHLKEKMLTTCHEETTAKQSRMKQMEQEHDSRMEKVKPTEDLRIKHMIEERRASLAEEERRAAQREEERRAREREAIAMKIKERREKQRQAEEERKLKQAEEERVAHKEKMKAEQSEESRRLKETEGGRKIIIEEGRTAKLSEEEEQIKQSEARRIRQQEEECAARQEQHRRAAVEEKQMRAAQEEQRRKAAEEEQHRRSAEEEQRRRAAEEEHRRRSAEEQRRRAAEEQQRRAAEEKQIRVAEEEQRRRAAEEEQRRRAAEEQQRRTAEEERRRAAEEEQRRRAAEEEHRRAAEEEQRRRAAEEEQQRKAAEEEQQRRTAEEQQRRAAEEERRRTAEVERQRRAAEEQQRRAAEEERRRAAEEERRRRAAEEQQRKAAEEQQRRAAEEQQRRAAEEEKQRRAAEEQKKRKAAEEEKRRAAEEQRRSAAEEEQRRIAAEEKQRAAEAEKRRATEEEQRKRAAKEEQHRRAAEEEQRRRAAEEEQRRRAAEEEQRRRAAEEEQRRRAAEEEKQKRAAEEEKRRAAEEQQRRATEEQRRRAAEEEQRRRAAEEEKQRKAAEEEKQRAAEEQRRRAAEEEQRRIAAEAEKQRKAAEEKQRAAEAEKRRAAEEEQRKRAAEEEKRRRAAEEEKQRADEEQRRRAAEEEQQRRAAEEEKQRRAAEEKQRRAVEEQRRRAAEEEKQRRAAEEQRRRAAEEERQRRAAEEERKRAAEEEKQKRAAEEQRRRAAEEERQKRAAEEQRRRAAEEEKQRRAAEEQRRRAAEEEKQRAAEEERKRTAEEEKQKRAAEEQRRRTAEEEKQRAAEEEQRRRATEEQQRRVSLFEDHQRRAAQEEHKRRAEQEEQQRRADLIEEQQRRVAQKEQQRRTTQEEQQRGAVQEEWQRRAEQEEKQRRSALMEEQRRKQREEKTAQMLEEEGIKQTRELQRAERQAEKNKAEREEWIRTQAEEGKSPASNENILQKYRQEKLAREDTTRHGKESQAALKEEEERGAREWMLAQREDEVRAKKREENLDVYREKEHAAQMEEQKRAAQRMDTLQYYSITSTETEKTNRRQQNSPVPYQRKSNALGHDPAEETRPYRPYTPASPAPSLPRSNTSSPALGAKPSMFRVKDNTLRGSSLTKSVKPRFHKNIGEDFRVGSPMGSDRGEEEQDIIRQSAGTPVHPGTGLNRLAAVKESSTCQTASLSQDYPAPPSHFRPRSRRSFALEEDDSRSIISNMSEDVESFATSATDLADIRGLYDYERPESACSFSSDVSRSLGKPPAVPPKSEKALRRAKRLTTRRMKKELAKAVTGSPALPEGSSFPASSSTEVHCSNRHAVASPHFSSPVSLAHAPTPGSSLPVPHSEHQSSHSYASPHATGPISIPVASPHATAPVSLPVAPPHTPSRASHIAAPKLVADVPSSPTLYQTNQPVPVTQYHVESGFPQSYPLTQRKVLQDLGSGQYFVVDVPVQVKTKTFFDPDTGKYVQLNVRESTKSGPRAQPQQTYVEPQLQSQIHAMPQQQHLSQDSPAGKLPLLYQGYPGYTKGYQPAAINSVHDNKSTALVGHYDQKPVRGNHSYRYPVPEMGQSSEEHRSSPEKTPYMDTVNNTDKPYNPVYNTHSPYELLADRDTKNQLAGGSGCENDKTAHPRYQPCDIIPVSELDDLMELSDW